MKTLDISRLLALAFLVCAIGQVSFAGNEKPGNIRVLDVTGNVSLTLTPNSAPQPLVKGLFVQQGQVIKTGKGAKALLLMSNGTRISVDQNTSFHVNQFLQTPFDASNTSFRDLKAEPSTSQTRISVTEGSIIAEVAKLAKGSTFKIGTPTGDVAIHGTLIQVTVNTTAGGSLHVFVNLPEGLADFAAANGHQVTLSNGETITVTSNPNTGTMTLSGVSPLSAQSVRQIQNLAAEVAAAIPAYHAFARLSADVVGGVPGQPGSAGIVGSGANGARGAPPVGRLYLPQEQGTPGGVAVSYREAASP